MSGGSFDYLYSKIEDKPLDWQTLDNLQNMVEWLSAPEQGQTEAAQDLQRVNSYLLEVKDKIDCILTQSLLDVLKAAEWWCSHDTNKQDFERVWTKHKNTIGSA